jgi:hypothetical protein
MTISPVQYLVAENGQRIGVVLSWDDYQNLQAGVPTDPDLLVGMDKAELQALADGMLASRYQVRLSELLERNQQGELDQVEKAELDSLIEKIDDLNALKARAILTLKHLE